MQIKADLHVHTTYSKDSLITPKDLVYYAKKRGLNAVAVTDHNQLEGSFKIAKETKDFLIIPGMEVSSSRRPHCRPQRFRAYSQRFERR